MLLLSCTQARLYYLQSELATLEGDPNLAVAPGPWRACPRYSRTRPEFPTSWSCPP
ncbi:hypothetical protein ACLESO_08975 [Pyxidicoccus sp. 3LG]